MTLQLDSRALGVHSVRTSFEAICVGEYTVQRATRRGPGEPRSALRVLREHPSSTCATAGERLGVDSESGASWTPYASPPHASSHTDDPSGDGGGHPAGSHPPPAQPCRARLGSPSKNFWVLDYNIFYVFHLY